MTRLLYLLEARRVGGRASEEEGVGHEDSLHAHGVLGRVGAQAAPQQPDREVGEAHLVIVSSK
eukprot:scaffold101933_cov45-Phaeocystis_antarctica.AAC.1